MMSAPLLAVRNVTRRFISSQPAVVDDVSLDLAAGEILALVGPSGCGKSTTLRMIAGLEATDDGAIFLNGTDITALEPEKRGIGMVFQDYALFPFLNVTDNILFGAPQKHREAAARFLKMVGLSELGQRFPDELSGGQQQRVALARSLAAEPGLILLDEPFSNLDAALRGATRQEIRRLLKSTGMAILCVTHDQEEALSFADRVAVMRDGRILQTGTPFEVYDRPIDPFVASFLGRTNFIPGLAHGETCETQLGQVPLVSSHAGPVSLLVRPEQVRLGHPESGEQGNGLVVDIEFRGHVVTYRVDCGGVVLDVDMMQRMHLAINDTVAVGIRDGVALNHWPTA